VSKKNVLITGASRGIGKAILESFGKEYYFIATATNDQSLKDIENNLQKLNLEGHASKLNLEDRNSIKEFVSSLEDQDISPHILINNAGITRDNIMLRMKEDEWDDVINVHLNGQYLLIKSFIKKMVKNKWGRIINISSTSAALGNKGQANYAAAKAGIEAMSRSLARELGARNINVNCVAPGFVETDMTKDIIEGNEDLLASQIPLGRLGKPEEIADVVNFLASEEANYITGQTIHVNGGLAML
jgi:3-oxoacyl-[acyl-carrier protein] reductase